MDQFHTKASIMEIGLCSKAKNSIIVCKKREKRTLGWGVNVSQPFSESKRSSAKAGKNTIRTQAQN